MPISLCDLNAAVDAFAPYNLAFEWDNVGLQVGDPSIMIERMLVVLELNESVIAVARKQQCRAILSHHPVIFRPQKSLRTDRGNGRLLMELVKSEIGLIAAHTNLDRVLRGTNGALSELLELRDVLILDPATVDEMYKFTVFVPRGYTPKLIEAIHRGGGGRIGNYSHCTFRSPGHGTFIPMDGAHPFIGRQGEFEQADEDRLEALVPRRALRTVLHEVRQAHPYEEVAFDVFPLHDADPKYGLGAVGVLPVKTNLRLLCNRVREACGAEFATFAGEAGMDVKRVAIVTGSAGSCSNLVTKAVADVLVTGELSYHLAQDAVQRGVGVIAVGHAASERIFAPHFCRQFAAEPAIKEAGLQLLPYTDFPEPWQALLSSPTESQILKTMARKKTGTRR